MHQLIAVGWCITVKISQTPAIAYLTRKYVQRTAPVAAAYSTAVVACQTALGRTGTYSA
jgi:hypothetical protein